MKIVRLEKALEVLQDCSGPEIEGLKSALKKAREAAREPPLEKQIAECKEFIEGSQKRVAAETVLLEDARQRLARLEQRVAAVPTVPEAAAGVANVDLLRAKLAEAEAERDELRGRKRRATTSTPVGPECPDSSNARRRAGVARLVARQTHRSQGCPRIWDTERDSANDIHGGRWCRQAGRLHDHGDHVKGGRIPQRFCRGGRDSRCGLRGVRVGEAANRCPGCGVSDKE